MWFHMYGDLHYKDKTAFRPSYFHHVNHHTRKFTIHIETGPGLFVLQGNQSLGTGLALLCSNIQRQVGYAFLQYIGFENGVRSSGMRINSRMDGRQHIDTQQGHPGVLIDSTSQELCKRFTLCCVLSWLGTDQF